ncbi:YtxH domain-containing protein [Latilactobacillus sp. 5-91]|uniref:YtxH domain-containing protein n=1 Tax=Latilactobacillus sp. 5-91 TaxID=3410924 RepID=UPI003C76BFFE
MSFSKGLLIGGLLGTTYALLTAKKTGLERQQAISHYLTDVTNQAQDVQINAINLQNTASQLSNEIKTTAVDSLADISDAVQTFSFEAQPRVAQISESIKRLTDDLTAL